MQCENARSLVPLYADGELSEAQAAPLRRHLMDCQTCREQVQSAKALQRWFVPTEAVPAPAGFAERVTAAALAPEPYEAFPADAPAARAPALGPAGEVELRRFVLRAVAAAAAVLLVLSAAIELRSRPSAVELEAVELPAVLEDLDELNRSAEKRPTDETPARPPNPLGPAERRR